MNMGLNVTNHNGLQKDLFLSNHTPLESNLGPSRHNETRYF